MSARLNTKLVTEHGILQSFGREDAPELTDEISNGSLYWATDIIIELDGIKKG